MRFAVLGSGSSGNATVVEGGHTTVLIDCGLSVKRLRGRAADLELDLADLDAIVVTHEHGDHIGGVATLARRYDVPVYMTHGTARGAGFDQERGVDLREISPHEPFDLGELKLSPAPVPHDAKEPCQFVIQQGATRIGILTDLGSDTHYLRQHFADCTALILEFNHDTEMLLACDYPDSVKRRISSRLGHFSNHQAQQLLERLRSACLRHVVAAHVSERANSHELVGVLLQQTLSDHDVDWGIAHQDRVTAWISV